ncbi:MAG: hypothetical protein ACREND_08170 [Gemmatimonadaceae bacterium]
MTRISLAFSILVLGLAGAVSGCGGYTGPTLPDLNGTWTLSLTNLSGSGISCNLSGTTMSLNQSGASFSGSYSGGVFQCVGGGEGFSAEIGGGSVIDGTIAGNTVSFDLDSPDFPLSGVVSGTSMSGTSTLSVDLGAPYGVITLSGNWGAAKQG